MANTAPLPGWIGYPVGFLAAIVVTAAAIAAHGTAHPAWTVTALAVTTLVIATLATLRASLLTAVFCWALYDGFVLGREGQLALSADALPAALVLVAVAVAGVPVRLAYLSAQQERFDSAR